MSTPEHLRPHPHTQSDWQHHGACRGTETTVFYSPEGERAGARARRERAAKQICQQCPVLTACRDHALTTGESHGIWGGLTERDRTRHHRRTRTPHRRTGPGPGPR